MSTSSPEKAMEVDSELELRDGQPTGAAQRVALPRLPRASAIRAHSSRARVHALCGAAADRRRHPDRQGSDI